MPRVASDVIRADLMPCWSEERRTRAASEQDSACGAVGLSLMNDVRLDGDHIASESFERTLPIEGFASRDLTGEFDHTRRTLSCERNREADTRPFFERQPIAAKQGFPGLANRIEHEGFRRRERRLAFSEGDSDIHIQRRFLEAGKASLLIGQHAGFIDGGPCDSEGNTGNVREEKPW